MCRNQLANLGTPARIRHKGKAPDQSLPWVRLAEDLPTISTFGFSPYLCGLWHACGRGWACSRKPLPVADVAAVGGWRDIGTLLKCYTQADSDTMLAVMESPKKISEKAVSR